MFTLGQMLAIALVTLLAFVASVCAQDGAEIEIVPTLGHSNDVKSVTFSPDGSRVLSGSEDKTIKLWDTATGALIRTFEHSGRVNSVAFSPDGRRVLAGGGVWNDEIWKGEFKLWEAVTGALIRTFEGHSQEVTSEKFSPDGRRVLSGSIDNTIKLWDVTTGALARTFEHLGSVNSVAFSPDGRRVLAGADAGEFDKGELRLWDAATGGLIRTFEGHSLWVNSVVFAPDGGRLLSGGGDETIKLWDPSSGALILTFNSGDAASVAFSPDGASVPIGSAFGAAAAPARSRGSSLLFGVDAGLERCKLSLRDLLLVPEPNECRGHFGICLDYAGEPVAERRAEERDEVSGSFAVAELLRANRQCLG